MKPMMMPGLPASAMDEDAARAFLEQQRWPNGVACPHCGSVAVTALRVKATSKRPGRKGVYQCNDCRQQFSVTVGTIFEDSKVPLHKWLMAIHFLCASKKGMSSHQLHRLLGVTYKTAWFMTHRIREAMRQEPLASKLGGIVEVDETYIGGKQRAHEELEKPKAPVVALVERQGRVVAHPVKHVTAKELKGTIQRHVDQKAVLMTDESPSSQSVGQEFSAHLTVCHRQKESAWGPGSTNTVEGFFSLLKRGITGTFHHVRTQHLSRDCDECSFRWNHRAITDGERAVAAIKATEGTRLFYKTPIK
ncbi:MAG TPA: IS1595 family transposase [Nitrospiria bacterium]|nr:IS1595 family transposase [Nitrospiria bacterium]